MRGLTNFASYSCMTSLLMVSRSSSVWEYRFIRPHVCSFQSDKDEPMIRRTSHLDQQEYSSY